MDQLIRRHRRFAMLILVAVAWLMTDVAAAAAGTADKLQTLVNDTAAQLQLAYRQHPDELARRQEQLTAAIAAWRAAPRSDANNERLTNWLRAAIVSSMPGSKEPLPAVPNFILVVKEEPKTEAHDVPAELPATKNAIETKTPVETVAKPNDDPFRDDPVNDSE